MRTLTHTLPQWLALTILAAVAHCAAAQANDPFVDPTDGPVWSAGGHYTAELDLQAAELRLFPLAGADQRLSLRHSCAPVRAPAAGVYLLLRSRHGYSLQPTHAHEQGEYGAIELTHCDNLLAPADALRVPAAVLHALEHNSAGALYVH